MATQAAYVKASSPGAGDNFGTSVALAGDGKTLAVGTPWAIEGATVHVLARDSAVWSHQQQLSGSDVGATEEFGASVALSFDGSTLAIGSPGEDAGAGAVHVLVRGNGVWSRQMRLVASHAGMNDDFGATVAVSDDGSTLAASSPGESSATQDDPAGNPGRGAVYMFSRSGASWSPGDRLALSSTDAADGFGLGLALSGDGASLAVGAPVEARSVEDEPADRCAAGLGGTVYRFARAETTWSSPTHIQGSRTCKDDRFGQALALSGDGAVLAVGANGEDNAADGINPGSNDDDASNSGAAYIL